MITKRLKMHWYVQDYSEKKVLTDSNVTCGRKINCSKEHFLPFLYESDVVHNVCSSSDPGPGESCLQSLPAVWRELEWCPGHLSLLRHPLWCSGPGLRLTHFTKQSENKCKNSHASCLFLRLDMNESQRRTRSGRAESFIRVNRS